MAKQKQTTQSEDIINEGLKTAKKQFLSGAKAVQKKYKPVAGRALRRGDGEPMAVHNEVERAISKAEKDL